MVNFSKTCNSIGSALFEYDTSKVVHIRCKKIGFVNRFIQLLIIGYVIGYAIVYKKGYQKFDEGLSSVTTKVKGIASTNLSLHLPVRYKNKTTTRVFNQGRQTWDSADYVTPAEENNAVFMMTNMILTPNQTQGKCPEYNVPKARCGKRHSDCVRGKIPRNGHGVMTGRCVPADRGNSTKMCEIYGWCPVEYNKLPMLGTNFGKPLSNKECLFKEAINFTILIKNTVRFPQFNAAIRNVDDKHIDPEYLEGCEYDHDDERARLCPIFRVKTIFDQISSTAFKDVAVKGGVIAIKITWDCNLDFDVSKCRPQYSFYRLDDASAKVAPGYSIRIAKYDSTDKKLKQRILIKAYGIRFVVLVDAKAGKFNIVPLLRNLGAGLALLGLATVLCDVCMLYCVKQRAHYRRNKYLYVNHEQEETQPTDEMAKNSNQVPYAVFDNYPDARQ